jgi:hypothetical protein
MELENKIGEPDLGAYKVEDLVAGGNTLEDLGKGEGFGAYKYLNDLRNYFGEQAYIDFEEDNLVVDSYMYLIAVNFEVVGNNLDFDRDLEAFEAYRYLNDEDYLNNFY